MSRAGNRCAFIRGGTRTSSGASRRAVALGAAEAGVAQVGGRCSRWSERRSGTTGNASGARSGPSGASAANPPAAPAKAVRLAMALLNPRQHRPEQHQFPRDGSWAGELPTLQAERPAPPEAISALCKGYADTARAAPRRSLARLCSVAPALPVAAGLPPGRATVPTWAKRLHAVALVTVRGWARPARCCARSVGAITSVPRCQRCQCDDSDDATTGSTECPNAVA